MYMKKILFLLALFSFLIPNVEVCAQLPIVNLKYINGQPVRMDTLSNGGRPLIIDFFASWCKPCNHELDAISEVYAEWQEETGVRLIAVSIDKAQDANKVKLLTANHNWEYDIIMDTNSELKRMLGVQVIPYVLVIDGQGRITYRHSGYTDGAETELIEEVRKLVRKQ